MESKPAYESMDNQDWHVRMRLAKRLAERAAQFADECRADNAVEVRHAVELLAELADAMLAVCS